MRIYEKFINSQYDQLQVGLIAWLVSRALLRHVSSHGFESRSNPNIFQALFPNYLCCVNNCYLLRGSLRLEVMLSVKYLRLTYSTEMLTSSVSRLFKIIPTGMAFCSFGPLFWEVPLTNLS